MNDVLDAINTRLRSPYFGYAILAFLALNWRGIFLLVVSEGDPASRLEAFDSVTSYWSLVVFPLIVGAVVAASSHWLKYLFLLIAKKPLELIENSNLEAEHKKAIRKSELEQVRIELAATRETELIERAKRDESIAQITDESKKKELEEEIGKIRRKRDIKITDNAKELLKAAASDGNGTIMKPQTIGEQSIQAGKRSFGKGSKRDYAAYDSALSELIENGYVKAVGHKGEIFELTHEGWEVVDAF
jgi:hypothetical protein